MKAFSFDKLRKTAAGVLAAVIIFAVLSPLAPRARALDDPAVDAEAAIFVAASAVNSSGNGARMLARSICSGSSPIRRWDGRSLILTFLKRKN